MKILKVEEGKDAKRKRDRIKRKEKEAWSGKEDG